MEYGLIGGRLGHSYSKVIHEMLCGYRYDLCPLPTEEEVRAFMTRRQFRAINVTIPYKLVVMEYCSYIDPHAKAINAVNTIVNRNGLLYGYNTDYPGFSYLCDAHGVEFKDRTVLILGTGGTHNTTWAVAHDRGAKQIYTVSRHPDPEKEELTYAQALTTGAQIIINTTPVGMYPNVGVSALDITSMPGLEAVIDVIYNPDKTELILRAEELGVPVAVGGLEMLVAQAVYAAEHFTGQKLPEAVIADTHRKLKRDLSNVAIIGMPGCGKSTTLNLLSGLQKPTSGRIFFGDDDVTDLPAENRGVGLVFQNYALYPHLTVRQNITFPLENRTGKDKLTHQQMADMALEAAKLVQIEELMDRKPKELSGGQQQRVGIARAFVSKPRVIFADEPTGNLDSITSKQVLYRMLQISKQMGTTFVMVTHEPELASCADRIITILDGKVQSDVVQDPATRERNREALFASLEGNMRIGGDSASGEVHQKTAAELASYAAPAAAAQQPEQPKP